MEKKGNHTAAKASTASILSVAMVLFASHAGGGFATGNQENTYFVCSGWAGLLSLALSMAILTGIIAIAMRLYNKYDLHSYKELFEKLYHPFDKLELVFELFFYGVILLSCLVSSAITLTFAFVDRFENSKVVDKVPTLFEKRCVLSAFIIILSVVISLGGLTNIIKYGYGYMGYLAIFLIIIPLLTVGVRKIRKG